MISLVDGGGDCNRDRRDSVVSDGKQLRGDLGFDRAGEAR